MLRDQLARRPLKRALATQPFVDDYPQCILVACWTWVSLDLLGSHVRQGARCPLGTNIERGRAMGDGGNAKVREQHLLSSSQQHIFWLDIAVNELLLVGSTARP